MSDIKNKLQCTVTGVIVSVAPKVFDQRAQVYGSAEMLRLNYISAAGRKLLVQGESLDSIRVKYNVPEEVPRPDILFIQKYTKWAKYRVNKKDIILPAINTNNE